MNFPEVSFLKTYLHVLNATKNISSENLELYARGISVIQDIKENGLLGSVNVFPQTWFELLTNPFCLIACVLIIFTFIISVTSIIVMGYLFIKNVVWLLRFHNNPNTMAKYNVNKLKNGDEVVNLKND